MSSDEPEAITAPSPAPSEARDVALALERTVRVLADTTKADHPSDEW